MKVCLERKIYGEKQTTGKLFVYDDDGRLRLMLHTLELPWKNNKRRVSCIPEGEYKVIKHRSPKFRESFWIQDVEGRSEILIHAGNYYTQILGCILVGLDSRDINGDGISDVVSSRRAIERLYHHTPNEFTLKIEKAMSEELENPEETTEETQEGQEQQEPNEDAEGPGGEIPQEDDEEDGPA